MKHQQAAFILHRRPFKNSSLILDCFTQEQGIISLVSQGVRKPQKKPLLDCFINYWIDYGGKNDLMKLYQHEIKERKINLSGKNIYCGLYINELLIKLLGKNDPYPTLFENYRQLLIKLSNTQNVAVLLRCFEIKLLSTIGYGIPFTHDNEQQAIVSNQNYQFIPELGFIKNNNINLQNNFLGKTLLLIKEHNFTTQETQTKAKQLMRLAINGALGDKPLHSRQLFQNK